MVSHFWMAVRAPDGATVTVKVAATVPLAENAPELAIWSVPVPMPPRIRLTWVPALGPPGTMVGPVPVAPPVMLSRLTWDDAAGRLIAPAMDPTPAGARRPARVLP